MQTIALHADARANAREAARIEDLMRRLEQYQPPHGVRVRALAARHERLMDLAASFPALLFALAAPRSGFEPGPVIARVIDGAPLRELSAAAGAPLWLRSIAPKAFVAPLPALPDGELFRRQIGNYLPKHLRDFDAWARAVGEAYETADQAVALWVAREIRRSKKKFLFPRVRGVCLWAWHSRFETHGLRATARWSPALAFNQALRHSGEWFKNVTLYLEVGESIDDMWLTPAIVDGYAFVPLRSADDIAAEAGAMKHCLAELGWRVRSNTSRFWSVRRGDQRVATLEVGYPNYDPFPIVAEAFAAKNEDAPRDVWLAARRWLNAHDITAVAHRRDDSLLAQASWIKQWRPYWLAKRRVPKWLPLMPSSIVLEDLASGSRLRVRRRRYYRQRR